MSFRIVMLVLLLLSRPLAALELNCGAGMDMSHASQDGSGHCAGHSGDPGAHQQTSDEQPGHTMAGGHCQTCVSGVPLIPATTRLAPIAVATAAEFPVRLRTPQFQSGPLYRPPIR